MNSPGANDTRSKSQPAVRGIAFPLREGCGEVSVELLADGAVRITDRCGDLPSYTLEFAADEWRQLLDHLSAAERH